MFGCCYLSRIVYIFFFFRNLNKNRLLVWLFDIFYFSIISRTANLFCLFFPSEVLDLFLRNYIIMYAALQLSTSDWLFGLFVALLVLLYFSFSSDKKQEPPGPRPVPLFGNLFQLDLKRLDQSLFDVSNLLIIFTILLLLTVYFLCKQC